MMKRKLAVSFFSLLSILFLIVACQKVEDSSDPSLSNSSNSGETNTSSSIPSNSENAKEVSFQLQLSAKMLNLFEDQASLPQEEETQNAFQEKGTDDILRGELKVTDASNFSNSESFDLTANFNSESYEVSSNRTLVLDPKEYLFELLLTKGEHQYVASTTYTIVDGTNDVPLNISPVFGDIVSGVEVIEKLSVVRFQYPENELTSFQLPQLEVIIDGSSAAMLRLNPDGNSDGYVSIAKGMHKIELNFYDGNLLIGHSKKEQEDQNIRLGVDLEMDIIPLQGETTFSLTESGSDATFKFNIDNSLIDEVGGVSNLETKFTLVSSKNGLLEQVLSLQPQGNQYYAKVTFPNFQYDTIAYSITFKDLRDEEEIGSCLEDEVVISPTTQQFLCPLTVRKRALASGHLFAALGVNVLDQRGDDPGGIKIYANNQLVGITGEPGKFGTDGYLHLHLFKGTYTILAVDVINNLSASEEIVLSSLAVENLQLTLESNSSTALIWDVSSWGKKSWQ